MTIEEIKQAIEDKKTEARSFTNAKDLEGAKKAMEELRALQETLKIEEELEQSEIRDLERQKEIRKDDVRMEKVNEFRSIVKSIMGEKKAGVLTPEERATITSTSVGTVIPKEFVNKVEEIKKGYGALKGYCDVITVSKNEGTIPVCNLDQNDKLGDVTEGDVIADGTFITTEIPFKCKKVGLIQSLSSESLEDAEVEIEGLINKNFAELAVATENKAIVTLLKASATAVDAATDYSDIQMAMDTVVPAVRSGMVCFTNVNGFAYLKNLKDGQKRPLNLVTEIGGKYYFSFNKFNCFFWVSNYKEFLFWCRTLHINYN